MKICDKCLCESVNDRCIICGKTKFLRDANENDCIYVASSSALFSRMIEDSLDEANIKYLRKSVLGSAVIFTIGSTKETYSYYVMLKDFEEAKSIVSTLPLDFSSDELDEYIDENEE